MQSSNWVSVLKLIPPELYHNLLLTTLNGTEINIQTIYRAETEYIVVRGRLAGSTEGGKLLFIPYDQINYLGFRDEMKEPEVMALLDRAPSASVEPKTEKQPTTPPVTPDAQPRPAPTPEPAAQQPMGPGIQPLPAKAALLERLRKARMGTPVPKSDK